MRYIRTASLFPIKQIQLQLDHESYLRRVQVIHNQVPVRRDAEKIRVKLKIFVIK